MHTPDKQEQETIMILVWPDGSHEEVDPTSEPPNYKSDDYKICEVLLSDLDKIAETASGKNDPIDVWVNDHLSQLHSCL